MTKAYSKRKLSRPTSHRMAMLRNLASALLMYEKLNTTLPRAKELKNFVERLITCAKAGKQVSHAGVDREVKNPQARKKLFEVIAPRYGQRSGGYTRIFRTGYRKGDAAETALIKLVP